MPSSMTGFANKTTAISIAGEKINVSISLKSLNSRFFEATCKMPSIVSHLETDIIKILQQKLIRGHVYLTLHLKNASSLKPTINANLTKVKSYIDACNTIKKKFDLSDSLNLIDIISLPDIFESEEPESTKAFDKQIIENIDLLTDELKKSREVEGQALKKDLSKRISIMEKEIEHISKNSEKLMEQKKEEITTLIQKIESEQGSSESANDLRKSHLLITLDKLDINEEIVRFKSHLENMRAAIELKEEIGKKLDFTLQEMAREINTIAAKCPSAKISGRAINIKVEIEKAREQSQNIV